MPVPLPPLVDFLVRFRLVLAIVWLLVALVGAVYTPGLDLQRSLDRLFDSRDGELRSYQTALRVFGPREPILVAYADSEAFEPAGMERLRRLEAHLDSLPGMVETTSLADVDSLLREVLGSSLADDGFLVDRLLKPLEGLTHSADRQTVGIVCLLDKRQPGEERRAMLAELRQWLAGHTTEYREAAVVGEPVMVDEGFRMLERDGARLERNASILLALVLILAFRSMRWVLITAIVVQSSLAVTRLTLSLVGASMTLVSTMFSSVVTVIAVAAVVHWIVRFREFQAGGANREDALRVSFRQILAPTFWACATDAAGFAALRMAAVEPVQDFGTIMIVGSCAVFLAVVCLVPALVLFPLPRFLNWMDSLPVPTRGSTWLESQLDRPLIAVRRSPKLALLIAAAISLLLTSGVLRTRIETDFTKNFRGDSPIVRDYRFVETRLGGAGVWEIVLPLDGPLDWERLQRVLRLEKRLRDEVHVETPEGPQAGLTQVLSVADAMVGVLPVDLDRLPWVNDFVVQQGLQQLSQRLPGLLHSLYAVDPDDPNRHYVRVLLRSRQQQAAELRDAIITQVRQICDEEAESWPPGTRPAVTGWFVLLTKIVDHLMSDQVSTLSVATLAILFLAWLATRSWRLAIIAIVPNLLPIGMVLGALGWAGIAINMGVALIAAVSVGLSIDSTLHYLEVYRRGTRQGGSSREALFAAQHRAGVASCFATVALSGGFLTMIASEFLPTVYFGVLVCVAMLGGLVGNLVVLPALLTVERHESEEESVSPKSPS